jgi:hypothetical protein
MVWKIEFFFITFMYSSQNVSKLHLVKDLYKKVFSSDFYRLKEDQPPFLVAFLCLPGGKETYSNHGSLGLSKGDGSSATAGAERLPFSYWSHMTSSRT